MQYWKEIINTGLLGTEKKEVAAETLPHDLQDAAKLIAAQPATDREEKFLQLAAVGFNFRQSGVTVLRGEAMATPEAEPEILPYCPTDATQVLKEILAEDNASLLAYWLERCCHAQRLAPPELVPALLGRAVGDQKRIAQDIVTACGRRGEWLSRLNPAWAASAAVGEEELWQTGSFDQRKMALCRTRQQDAGKTREWLLQTWPQENANAKAELLKQLDGLVEPEDEPWLVSLLAEKSQKVKDEATALLRQLPSSALVQQYQELLRPLISLKKEKAMLGLINKTVLHIQLPVVPDKGEYAPGIEKLSNDKSFNDGEFILFQLMQAVPLKFWEEHFGQQPPEILANFAGKTEKFLSAFIAATVTFRDRHWALVYSGFRDIFYEELLPLLPPDQQEIYCLRNFSQHADQIIKQARHWNREWSLPLAKEILAHMSKRPYEYPIAFYKTTMSRLPVGLITLLEGAGPGVMPQQNYWNTIAEEVGKLLGLKERTQNAFKEIK
jgi:Family of unknown function (DUF5691)